jgi:dienelactone hydrolase
MVITRDVAYAAEGLELIGRLAVPEGVGTLPGVLIAHEGGGLDDYQKSRAERFADLGYVAFALDYFGGGRPLSSQEEMAVRCRELWDEPERIRTLAHAGLEVLTGDPRSDPSRLAAVGYCFGGAVVLELARSGADIKAVVGFHPRLATRRPGDAHKITAKVLVCVGTEDPLISAAERMSFEEEMQAGGVDWRMNLYGNAEHSFTRPAADRDGRAGVGYHRLSDERSWRAMLDLFDEVLACP